jgi:hypothetical protein
VTFTVEKYEEPNSLPDIEITQSSDTLRGFQQTRTSTSITVEQIQKSGAKRLSDVLRSFEPGGAVTPPPRTTTHPPPRSWSPYLIYLDGAYVQYLAGSLDNIIDVNQIETIEISRWVGAAPNFGPGTSDRVILITTKRGR